MKEMGILREDSASSRQNRGTLALVAPLPGVHSTKKLSYSSSVTFLLCITCGTRGTGVHIYSHIQGQSLLQHFFKHFLCDLLKILF